MRSKSRDAPEGDDGDNFRRAREAYEILADPDARARHDAGQSAASRRATTVFEVDLGAYAQWNPCWMCLALGAAGIRLHVRGRQIASAALAGTLELTACIINADDMELDEDTETYSHTCRCSGSYTITGDQLSEVMKLEPMRVLWDHRERPCWLRASRTQTGRRRERK